MSSADFLSFFDNEPVEPNLNEPLNDFLQYFDEPETDQQAAGQVSQEEDQLQLVQHNQNVFKVQVSSDARKLIKLTGRQRASKVTKKRFYYSRGSVKDRKAWNLDMQLKRSIASRLRAESDIMALLTSLRVKTQSSSIQIRKTKKGQLFTKSGLIRIAELRVKTKGNRFELKYSLQDFLTASFGDDTVSGRRAQGRNAQALASKISPRTISYMRAVTFGAIMARQCNLLARIFLLCKMNPPLVVGVRDAWDETSQKMVVKGEHGEFQVMVVKKSLLILWESEHGARPHILKLPVAAWS